MVQIHPSPPFIEGGVAQLVEHLVCNQAVVGSNPVASTIGSAVKENEIRRASSALLFENKVNWFAAWQPRMENKKSVVKLQRVYGGCLGVQSRRRTWLSCDKLREVAKQAMIRRSPRSGNRPRFKPRYPRKRAGPQGTETSQYL